MSTLHCIHKLSEQTSCSIIINTFVFVQAYALIYMSVAYVGSNFLMGGSSFLKLSPQCGLTSHLY